MKKIKKLLFETCLVFCLVFASLAMHAALDNPANAAFLPNVGDTGEDASDFESELKTGGIAVPPSGKSGQDLLNTIVIERGLTIVKNVTLGVGILYIILIGYALLSKGDQEEEVTNQKRAFTYTLIAFMMISMGEELAAIFDMGGDKGTILQNAAEVRSRVALFDTQVEIAITFIKYTIGVFATFMLVRSGIKLVTAGGDEEQAGTHKKSILYSAGGLAIIFIGEVFIKKVFYKINPSYSAINGVHPGVDVKEGVEQIVGITNFVVTLVAPIAVLMLVVAAIMYATANGNEEQMDKAKRMIVSTVVAIFIIFGAFAVVSSVISGRLTDLAVIDS